MTFTISQQDFWSLVFGSPPDRLEEEDCTWHYSHFWGKGSHRLVTVRNGLELSISQYQHLKPIVIQSPDRPHPLEYGFLLNDASYYLCGSGLAPAENCLKPALTAQVEICVHMELEIFTKLYGNVPTLSDLTRSVDQTYFQQQGKANSAMQTALHQLLHCPYEGITKKIYLESKVWELMALLLEDLLMTNNQEKTLKPDDIDRIQLARQILISRMESPPSLIDLAHQVGLNECTLKRGFREVFGTTAFGFLHDYRLELSRQLLSERRLNVSQIAKKVGFASRSYFASAFRKKYGLSPSQLLRNSP